MYRYIKSGSLATVRIKTNGIICCEKFSEVPQLGRFTLRDEVRGGASSRIQS